VQKQQANAITEYVQTTLEEVMTKLNGAQYREATSAALIQDAIDEVNLASQSTTQPSQVYRKPRNLSPVQPDRY
jgi:hypothetical protein